MIIINYQFHLNRIKRSYQQPELLIKIIELVIGIVNSLNYMIENHILSIHLIETTIIAPIYLLIRFQRLYIYIYLFEK